MNAMGLNLPTEQDATTAQSAVLAFREVGPLANTTTIRLRRQDAATEGRGKLCPRPARAPQNPEPTGLRVLSRSAENAHRVEYLLE